MTKKAPDPADKEYLIESSTMQVAAMQVSTQLVQDCLFFTLLSLDVRLVIYDFFYEFLPPLSYKKFFEKEDDCRGIMLACKQAHNELSDAAARHLKFFFDEFVFLFQDEHQYPINLNDSIRLYQDLGALRIITLVLDANAIPANFYEHNEDMLEDFLADQDDCGEEYQWRRLLQHPFEKVTLLITDNGYESRKSVGQKNWWETPGNLARHLRMTLSEIAYNIGTDWHQYQEARDYEFLDKLSHAPENTN